MDIAFLDGSGRSGPSPTCTRGSTHTRGVPPAVLAADERAVGFRATAGFENDAPHPAPLSPPLAVRPKAPPAQPDDCSDDQFGDGWGRRLVPERSLQHREVPMVPEELRLG